MGQVRVSQIRHVIPTELDASLPLNIKKCIYIYIYDNLSYNVSTEEFKCYVKHNRVRINILVLLFCC